MATTTTSTAMTVAGDTDWSVIEKVVIGNDLKQLTDQQRVVYYRQLCESLHLNALTRPFQYMTLQGKLTLYATKDAAEQIRKRHGVSITRLDKESVDDIYVVTAYARTPDGREDSDMGAVSIAGKRGDDLVNAMLKAATKAKRRVTLSICGLGMLDETEIETIAHARPIQVDEDGVIVEQTEAVRLPFGLRPEQWANLHSMATAKGVEIDPLMTPGQIAGAIRKAGGPAIPGAITPRAIKDALDALTVHQAPSDQYDYAVAREEAEDDPYAEIAAATDAGRTLPLVKE